MDNKINFKKNPSDNSHYRQLRKLIKNVTTDLPKSRIFYKRIMTVILPLTFLLSYLLALSYRDYMLLYFILFAVLGIISVLIFINVIHDAVHDNIFKKQWANNALILLFDLIGGNSYIWKQRHMVLHHNYQNISGWDSDIEQAGLIKIYPQGKKLKINNYQHWFIFFFYPLYLFNWILIRDFKDFFLKERIIKKVCKIPFKEYVKLFFFKGLFIFYIVGLPILLDVHPAIAIGAMSTMFIVGSIFAMLSLLTPHVNETNQFPLPDAKGKMNVSWFEHQFITTNDINLNNWFTRNFMGNFNFHLVHHLFPNINSVYAPEVTKAIQQYAEENNISYRSYGLFEALKYHYRLIKSNAVDFDVFEEDM